MCAAWCPINRHLKKRAAPAMSRAALYYYSASSDLRAELGDVLGGGTLLALHDVELDTLAFSQRLEAVAIDGGVVNEAILLSVLGGDEAKALGVVKPLYFAGGTHCGTSSFIVSECRVCGTCR